MNTSLPPPPPVPPPLPPQMFVLPKCCGCFDLRIGSILSCFIWAALSMFLAVMSFKNQNVFFSYLTVTKAPTIIFGVINLILSIVATVGMVILIINSRERVKSLSHAIWVCISLVLSSMFANLVVYLRDPNDHIISQCITDSKNQLEQSLLTLQINATLDNSSDYYHCSRLREDELKFGIISFVLMFSFYVYWALCLYRYRYAPTTLGGPTDFDVFPEPFDLQPAMATAPPPPSFVPGDRATIILTNQRPKRLSVKGNQ